MKIFEGDLQSNGIKTAGCCRCFSSSSSSQPSSPSAGSSTKSRQLKLSASIDKLQQPQQEEQVFKKQLKVTKPLERTQVELELKPITATTSSGKSQQKQQLEIPEVAITEVSSSPSPRPSSSEGKVSIQTLTKTEDKGGRRGGGEEEEVIEVKEEKEELSEQLSKAEKERQIQESKGARPKEHRKDSSSKKGRRDSKSRTKDRKERISESVQRISSSIFKPLTPSPSRATLQEEPEVEAIPEKSIAKGMRLVIESVIETTDPEAASAIKGAVLPTTTPAAKKGIHLDLRSQIPKSEDVEEKRSDKIIRGLEDMKQRLRFLRRRHTDSSISSKPSVRPTPEQASKWSESFELLMNSRYGASLFKAFLSREYSQENVEFWIAVEEYKRARPSKLSSKAKKIYEDFIAIKSSKEINVEAGIRSDIKSNLGSPSVTTFDVAQRKIQGLLESDAYLRFLQSNLYKELLIPKVVLPPTPLTTATTQTPALSKLSSSDSAVTIKSAASGESFQSMLIATGGRGKSTSPPKSSVSSTNSPPKDTINRSGSSSPTSSQYSSSSSRSNSASSGSSCRSPSMASSEGDDEEQMRRRFSHSSRENEESVL